MKKPRTLSSPELALLYARCDGLIRLIAISLSIGFWFILAVIALSLYLYNPLSVEALYKPYQVASALGLSPIALGVLTWRLFEKICCRYLDSYLKKYLDL